LNETLHNARGLDETRVRRAFGWIVTFRDFPEGSYQTVDGDSMMTEALTLFTRGRAEFYLDGVRRGDRLPGILSSEHEVVGKGGTFEIRYVEPTTRLCVPAKINRHRLPTVQKLQLDPNSSHTFFPKQQILVCLGTVTIDERVFSEEQTFRVGAEPVTAKLSADAMLLEFL
jgi:hypothetical protein